MGFSTSIREHRFNNCQGKSTDCRRLAGQLSHDDVRKNDDRKAREVSRGSREFDGRSIPEIGRDDAVDTTPLSWNQV
ncbi:PREDICTED: uncharacterized protein LOC105152045 isoform X2 [Acromyrmex echinatior]|uniref:uncharacterized protein LOC105152045 isoform X2 n=1 Tax=Acromyrmex echinatior TaxID=103372 RepID=UPI000580EBBC|nr:PREDICTED: uncharacterized protein LOC105152045 isoform X2 [Acromyrmex echinatior]